MKKIFLIVGMLFLVGYLGGCGDLEKNSTDRGAMKQTSPDGKIMTIKDHGGYGVDVKIIIVKDHGGEGVSE